MLTIALDPSKGVDARRVTEKRADNDYSAFVAVARTIDGLLYVDADLDNRRDSTRIIDDGLELCGRWPRECGAHLDGFGVESDFFQFLIGQQFTKTAKARGILLPLYDVPTRSVPKPVRIRRLTPHLNRGEFRWRNTPGTRTLVRQMQQFPLQGVGIHDDGPDALEIAIRLSKHLWNGNPRKGKR